MQLNIKEEVIDLYTHTVQSLFLSFLPVLLFRVKVCMDMKLNSNSLVCTKRDGLSLSRF